VKKKRERDMMH